MARGDDRNLVASFSRIVLWVIWAWVVVDLVLLAMAFFLRLFGANPQAGFTEWVYRSVQRAMAPFRGIFEPIPLTDDSVLDTSLLFAMIVYGIIALFLRAALDWIADWTARRAHQRAVAAWTQQAGSGDVVNVNVGAPGAPVTSVPVGTPPTPRR